MAASVYVTDPAIQCHGKRPHSSKSDAKRARREMENRIGARMDVYRCPHCDLWHTGHRPKRRPAS